MKSLKQRIQESIISSTGTGKKGLVQRWIDENLPDCYLTVNSEGKIVMDVKSFKVSDYSKKIEEIPDYISFANTDSVFYLGTFLNKKIKREQLPEYAKWWSISGKTEKIENFKCKAGKGFKVEYDRNELKKIRNIEIEFNDVEKAEINLYDTNIDFDSLQQIKSNAVILYIQLTPAARKLLSITRKIQKESTEEGSLDENLNKIFKNLPNLRFVYISSRKYLEYNPENGHWYLRII